MARAIHRISVAKGYDPADYVLVAFGGAGGQHACAVARELGIRQILISPQAGVLSAYGIGLADVRRYGERSVLQSYSTETLAALEPIWQELEDKTRQDVLADGVAAANISPPLRSLDMRYRGVEATLNVATPTDGDFAARYEQLHEQLYGYRHAGRPIEVTAARVEVVGSLPAPEEPVAETVLRAQSRTTTDVIFAGHPQPTAVFLRDDLRPGDEFDGPAIVCEPTSTVVVDPGFQAQAAGSGRTAAH